jgi:hypothetical protein
MPNKQTRNAAKGRRQAGLAGKTTIRSGSKRGAERTFRNGELSVPRANQPKLLTEKLTPTHVDLLNYIAMVSDPDAVPVPVPLLLGEYELETDQYRVELEGVATAGAAGGAFVSVGIDAWLEDAVGGGALAATQFFTYAGGTLGSPVWSSTAASNATTVPTVASVPGTNSTQALPLLDPGFTTGTRYRLTSCHLEVWSDAPALTAQGDVAVAFVRSEQAYYDNALNSASFDTVAKLPQSYVVHDEFPLSGWQSGHRVHAHVTPWAEQCVRMNEAVAVGYGTSNCPIAGMVAVCSGMSSGQTMRFRVVMTYECTKPKTYRFSINQGPQNRTEPSTAMNALSPLRGQQPTLGPLGHAAGKIASAIPSNVISSIMALKHRKPAQSALERNLSQPIINGISNFVSKVPYVGGLLKSGLDWILS